MQPSLDARPRHGRLGPRARAGVVRAVLVASLATAAALLVVNDVLGRSAYDASRDAAAILDDALPGIAGLAETRGRLRHVREAALQVVEEPGERARRRLGRAVALLTEQLERSRRLRRAQDHRLALGIAAVASSAVTLTLQEGDPAELAAALVRATDEVDRALEALIERDVRAATAAERAALERQAQAGRSSRALLWVSLLSFGLLAFVTERLLAHAQQATLAQVEELDAFTARVAHDLRDPLAPIALTIDLLRREPGLSDGARRHLDRQESALQRAQELIEALLAFARAGGPPSAGGRSDVAAVVQEVEASLVPVAERAAARLVTDVPPGLEARLPPAVLGAVVTNLAKNALVHLGDAPARTVTVRAREEGRAAVLEVEDHGPGIPEDLLPGLFRPFTRGPTGSAGHGLGLATTKRLVEAYGGSLSVSTTRGAGSTFVVRLPAARRGA